MTDRHWFPVSAGLLTAEHYQRLGTALMLFLWFIHEERQPKDGEEDTGAVRNGEPISCPEISAATGLPVRTVERHMAILKRERYIRTEPVVGKGNLCWIANPIRWKMTSKSTGVRPPEVAATDKPTPPEAAVSDRQKWRPLTAISGGDNKEVRTNNNSYNLKPLSDEENQPNPPSQEKKPTPLSAEGMTLANELLAEILTNKPDFHMTDDRLAKWARSADLMIATDKRSPPRISALIRWVQHDGFWRTNVLSMDKLREKFDQLEMKAQQTAKGGNVNGKQLSSDEYLKQALAAAARMRGTVQ